MTDQTPPAAPLSQAEDRQWASFAHLGGILSFLPPLIIWLVFKDRGSFTDQEAKESLNFQITVAIAQIAWFVVNLVLTAITFGFWSIFGLFLQPLIAFAIWAGAVVFCIIAFTKTKDGIAYRYPLTLRLVK
ncbi:DUF4870 domain-containing protein [Salinibacterium sp. dk2585]|uniref:DUF4870 domain-containing protein n=1 Tax=unclassified Salinibacterium TaxID=2632331 RepID=UPI0011C251B1|nr:MULTISPECIES: DUF4870 domain-containing protein [unclassified Salinibacterium]QEE61404.1 DUF4870 domain-containing protein [Salinibacterium sp. dk2585]TXK54081.1 DUF4870 domain-containing protein [Salinibacterium sp. dk5596]